MKKIKYNSKNIKFITTLMTLCFVVALLGVFIPSRKEVKDLDKETVGGMQIVYVDLYHNGGEIDSEWSSNMQKKDSYYETAFVAYFDVLLPTSEEVTKPGCVFDGWYTNREFLGEPITEIKSIEDYTSLYAKWITLDMEKKASWHQVNGKKFDENGNPYVKIDITFDCSNLDFSLYKGKKIDIEDYIPAEFSVLEDTIKIKDSSCVDYGESFDSANNIVSAYWDNESAPDKTPSDYELSFVMTLNLKKVFISRLKETGVVYTNGDSIYKFTEKSAIIDTTITNETQYLPSASVDCETLFDMLYDGDVSLKKSPDMDIDIVKTASWTEYNGSKVDANGDPYVLIEFNIDASEYCEMYGIDSIEVSSVDDDKDKKLSINTADGYPRLMDNIPKEFTIIEESIKCNRNVTIENKVEETDTGHRLEAKFLGTLGRNIVKYSFVMVLDKEKLGEEYLSGEKRITTNGSTIDSSVGSYGSSYLVMIDWTYRLDSPSIRYKNPEDEKNGVFDVESTKERLDDMINAKKTASWTEYNGAKEDANGNPYVLIEFVVDPTEYCEMYNIMSVSSIGSDAKGNDDDKKLNVQLADPTCKVVDYIPNEFTVLEDTIKTNLNNVNTKIKDDSGKTMLEARLESNFKRKLFEYSFIMVLDKSKLPEEYISGEKRLNTNGTTIDSSVDSLGSSYIYADYSQYKLYSPSLKYGSNDNSDTDEDVTDAPIVDKVDTEKNKIKSDTKKDNDDNDAKELDDTPATEDTMNINKWYMLMVLSVMAMCYVIKKYKSSLV